MKRILLAVALMNFVCAHAQESPSGPIAQANAATRLFMDLCIPSAGDTAKLRELADRYHLRHTDVSFSQTVLRGKPGEVWSASSSVGEYVVISQPDNSCSVWARRADAATSINQFKRIVLGTGRPGLMVKVLEDRDIEGQGGTYHYLSYLLSKEGRQSGLYASAIASASPTAEVQVRLRLMPAKAE
ncbi:NMCC_0638 family (lipo)protein [Paraburkholderia lacunae]|uniref:Uncharacterized protein n=1 Tax=Paraburkholderia lacunae TaxID=2211104 RepID=A0A370N6G1_9BURK|nr:hypothetical protein [Paraburkholderia lacunae]RDK01182.1 hypothetical protein DLM46_17795 [Paraburkholderia lacunae]